MKFLQSAWVVAITAVTRPAAGLKKSDIRRLFAQCIVYNGGVRGGGPHRHVICRNDGALVLGPKRGQVMNHALNGVGRWGCQTCVQVFMISNYKDTPWKKSRAFPIQTDGFHHWFVFVGVCVGALFTFYSWAMHNAGNVFWFVDGKAACMDSGHGIRSCVLWVYQAVLI